VRNVTIKREGNTFYLEDEAFESLEEVVDALRWRPVPGGDTDNLFLRCAVEGANVKVPTRTK